MAIANQIERYLNRNQFQYDVILHSHSRFSMETAESAHVPGDQLAKAVILKDHDNYAMAILPSTHRLDLGRLRKQCHRDFGLATEDELGSLFQDCEPGAVPPVGQPYDLPMYLDEELDQADDIYFESGDHDQLIHMSGREFQRLTAESERMRFSHHH